MALAIDPTEGVMTEFYLTDERWALIATRVPEGRRPGCHGRDNRLFIEAVLWIAELAPLARLAGTIRQMVHRLHPLSQVDEKRRLAGRLFRPRAGLGMRIFFPGRKA